jgi:hypothetical protein
MVGHGHRTEPDQIGLMLQPLSLFRETIFAVQISGVTHVWLRLCINMRA